MRVAGFSAIFLALAAAGCAVTPTPDVTAFAAKTGGNSFEIFDRELQSSNALVLPLVHDRQTSGPSCGAHALASVINYWRRDAGVTGEALYAQTPPRAEAGYSMAELISLAQAHHLTASAVRLSDRAVIRELENGRPVLLPVRLPSIYVQQRSLPGADAPVIGLARNTLIYRAGRVSEWTDLAMVDHYLLAIGYDDDMFVVLEPVMGYRTISADKLERYRAHFGDAAIVFSGSPARAAAR